MVSLAQDLNNPSRYLSWGQQGCRRLTTAAEAHKRERREGYEERSALEFNQQHPA